MVRGVRASTSATFRFDARRDAGCGARWRATPAFVMQRIARSLPLGLHSGGGRAGMRDRGSACRPSASRGSRGISSGSPSATRSARGGGRAGARARRGAGPACHRERAHRHRAMASSRCGIAACPLARYALGHAHGVSLVTTRDSIAFDARGLGYGAANLTLVARRGAAADTLVVSRLGRTRVLAPSVRTRRLRLRSALRGSSCVAIGGVVNERRDDGRVLHHVLGLHAVVDVHVRVVRARCRTRADPG